MFHNQHPAILGLRRCHGTSFARTDLVIEVKQFARSRSPALNIGSVSLKSSSELKQNSLEVRELKRAVVPSRPYRPDLPLADGLLKR